MDRQAPAHKPRLSVVGDRYFILFLGYSALLCLYGPRHALASPPFCCPSASFLARPFGSVTPRRGKPLLTPRTKAAADEAGGGERPRGARPTSPLALVHGSTLPLALLQARSPSAMRSSTGCPRAATPPQMRKTDPAAPPTHTLQSAHARTTAVAPSSIATPLAT